MTKEFKRTPPTNQPSLVDPTQQLEFDKQCYEQGAACISSTSSEFTMILYDQIYKTKQLFIEWHSEAQLAMINKWNPLYPTTQVPSLALLQHLYQRWVNPGKSFESFVQTLMYWVFDVILSIDMQSKPNYNEYYLNRHWLWGKITRLIYNRYPAHQATLDQCTHDSILCLLAVSLREL